MFSCTGFSERSVIFIARSTGSGLQDRTTPITITYFPERKYNKSSQSEAPLTFTSSFHF